MPALIPISTEDIFTVDECNFNDITLKIFCWQYWNNPVYQRFANILGRTPERVARVEDIPFLPISFFKTHRVACFDGPGEALFMSSGTGGVRSRHMVYNLDVYRQSALRSFRLFFGDPAQYEFFFLVPEPQKNPESSLAYMCHVLQCESRSEKNGFFLDDQMALATYLKEKNARGQKKFLLGITWALLDFFSAFPELPSDLIVVETGGMKGRREEMVREQLHLTLMRRSGIASIYSEYGMAELMSQAWSPGNGVFHAPPWMKILVSDITDPLSFVGPGEKGGINIIDLACISSCSFISTQDTGRLLPGGGFTVEGRYDHSEARGCSLML